MKKIKEAISGLKDTELRLAAQEETIKDLIKQTGNKELEAEFNSYSMTYFIYFNSLTVVLKSLTELVQTKKK